MTMLYAKIQQTILLLFCLLAATAFAAGPVLNLSIASGAQPLSKYKGYTGSVSCRECHEKFYKLWAPSHHGLAMQPFTAELLWDGLLPA